MAVLITAELFHIQNHINKLTQLDEIIEEKNTIIASLRNQIKDNH